MELNQLDIYDLNYEIHLRIILEYLRILVLLKTKFTKLYIYPSIYIYFNLYLVFQSFSSVKLAPMCYIITEFK